MNCSGEHADVRGAFAARSSRDLENRARRRRIGMTRRAGEQVNDAGHQRFDARSRDGGAEEDGVDERGPGLGDQFGPKTSVRQRR